MAGGAPGAAGENRIERGGRPHRGAWGPTGQAEMGPGDVFVITTPGGGGYGGKIDPEAVPSPIGDIS